MKTRRVLWAVAFGVVALAAAEARGEASVDDCKTLISQVQAQVQDATFTGKTAEVDQAVLVVWLESARDYLDDRRFDDAIARVAQARDRVVALSTAGKLNSADAALLVSELSEILGKLEQLPGATPADS